MKYFLFGIGIFLFTATSAHAQHSYQDDTGYGGYGTYQTFSDTPYGSQYVGSGNRQTSVCLYKNAKGECMVEQFYDAAPASAPTYSRQYLYEECVRNSGRRNADTDCNYYRTSNRHPFYDDYRRGYYQGSYYGRNHGDPRYDCWAPIDDDEDYKTICDDN